MDQLATASRYDDWLRDDSGAAALAMRQWLVPVEGQDAVIFPPTYAKPERVKDEDWMGYNMDRLENGTKICQIDSVGSQANRMEPIFLRPAYRDLVPSVVVKATVNGHEKCVNLLEAGHRAADAIVRFSSLWREFEEAFKAIRDSGNAEPLARLGPTSIVFGAWDSRGTQVKLPRILRSVVRAYDVQPLHRSAQYIPPVDYIGEGLLEAPEGKAEEDSMSQLGLRHAPAPWTHGGIQVHKEIRREAVLNLAALRALGCGAGTDPLPLRRYIFALALVALTAPQETSLREGCQLVPDAQHPAEWNMVHHDGKREPWTFDHEQERQYAIGVARAFGVGSPKEGTFDAKSAKRELGQTKEERKKSRRSAEAGKQGETN